MFLTNAYKTYDLWNGNKTSLPKVCSRPSKPLLGLGLTPVGSWVLGLGSWALGLGFWVLGLGYWVLGLGFWVLGLGFWVIWVLDFGLFGFLL